ncbi:MAG: DNA polymerase III subunit delta' [Gammaproteobacteria bacterium]
MATKPEPVEAVTVDPTTLRVAWLDAAWQRLGAQLDGGRMPHAVLITGLPGIGKDRFALRLAMRLLCERPHDGDACRECRGCVQFAAGTHPDYHLLAPREAKKQIVIDQVREGLVDTMQLTSQHGGWKIALITPADAMNRSTANALLKTLEEPSGRSVLILVTSNPSRLPATIRSRCQRVPLAPPMAAEATAWLKDQRVRDPDLMLALAGGAPLAAAALQDADLLAARPKLVRALTDLVSGQGDAPAAAGAWAALPFAGAVDWLQTVVHDLIRLRQLGPDARLVNADLRRDLQSTAHRLDWRALHRHLDELGRLRAIVESPVVAQLQWEGVMIAWAERLDVAPINQ